MLFFSLLFVFVLFIFFVYLVFIDCFHVLVFYPLGLWVCFFFFWLFAFHFHFSSFSGIDTTVGLFWLYVLGFVFSSSFSFFFHSFSSGCAVWLVGSWLLSHGLPPRRWEH